MTQIRQVLGEKVQQCSETTMSASSQEFLDAEKEKKIPGSFIIAINKIIS